MAHAFPPEPVEADETEHGIVDVLHLVRSPGCGWFSTDGYHAAVAAVELSARRPARPAACG
jgi:hypothetical protein